MVRTLLDAVPERIAAKGQRTHDSHAELPLEHPAKLRRSDPLRQRPLLSLQGAPAHSNSREHQDSMSGNAKTASIRQAADAE